MKGRDSISINSICSILGLLQRFSARISYVNAFMTESKWKIIAQNAVHVKCRMHNGDVHFLFVFVSSGYRCEIAVSNRTRTKKEFAKYVFLSQQQQQRYSVQFIYSSDSHCLLLKLHCVQCAPQPYEPYAIAVAFVATFSTSSHRSHFAQYFTGYCVRPVPLFIAKKCGKSK